MNPESEHNKSDSTSPHHETGDDTASEHIEYIGEVQEHAPTVEPIVAEIVPTDAHSNLDASAAESNENATIQDAESNVAATQQTRLRQTFVQPAPIANELKNISANGGAVGAIVLGTWSILCSLITPFSAINALLALLLGTYGLTSQKKKLAVVGMLLGIIGGAMSLIETNEILNDYFAEEAAS